MGLRKTTRREIKQIIIIILLSSGFFFLSIFSIHFHCCCCNYREVHWCSISFNCCRFIWVGWNWFSFWNSIWTWVCFFVCFFFDSVHSNFNLMALASWDSMAAPPHRFPLSATSTVSVSRSSPDVLQELCTENSPEVFSHDWCSIPSNFIGKFTTRKFGALTATLRFHLAHLTWWFSEFIHLLWVFFTRAS